MTEEWRPVPGYEGLYEVSNRGRIRSLPRMRNTRWGMRLMGSIHVLSPSTSRVPGYESVLLHKDGGRRSMLLHRLVALAWLPPALPGQDVCRHLDDNSLNNRVENLAWGTASDNQLDAVRNGVHAQTRKTHCPQGHPYSGSNLEYQRGNWGRKCKACRAAKGRRLRRMAAAHRVYCGATTAAGPPCKRPAPCHLHQELTAAATAPAAA